MSIPDLEERLASMQDAFNQAPAEGTSQFDPPPDGDYQGLVKEFDVFEGGTPKQLFLKTVLEVVHHPEHNGRTAETVHVLEDPERLSWLKQHLAILGADVDTLDLTLVRPGSPLLSDLLDTPVDFTVKTSKKTNTDGKPYRNVYVNRSLGAPIRSDVPAPGADGAAAAPVVDDQKIPF